MAKNKEQWIEYYQKVKTQAMFAMFLKNMTETMKIENSPVMEVVEKKGRKPSNTAENPYAYFNLPNKDTAADELSSISNADLLCKAKYLVAKLSEDIPDKDIADLTEEEKNDLEKKGHLIPAMVRLRDEFMSRYNATTTRLKTEKGYKISTEEFRLLEFGKGIFDEVMKISDTLVMGNNNEDNKFAEDNNLLDEYRKKSKELKDTKAEYLRGQEKLRYELDELKQKNKTYNLGKIFETYSDGEKGFLSEDNVILTTENFLERPELYSEENNYLDKQIGWFDDEILKRERKFLNASHKHYQIHLQNIAKASKRFDTKDKELKEQYEEQKREYDGLQKTLKSQKKFSEYQEYQAYQEALESVGEASEDLVDLEDEYYRSDLMNSLDYDALIKDEEKCTAELALLETQIRKAEADYNTSKGKEDEAKQNYSSAKEVAEKSVDDLLKKSDSQIVEDMVGLHISLLNGRRAYDINKLSKAVFNTPGLQGLRRDAEKKQQESKEADAALDTALNDKYWIKNFESVLGDVESILDEEEHVKVSRTYAATTGEKGGYFAEHSIETGIKRNEIAELRNEFNKSRGRDFDAIVSRFGDIVKKVDVYRENIDAQIQDVTATEMADKKLKDKILGHLQDLSKNIGSFDRGRFNKRKVKVTEDGKTVEKTIRQCLEDAQTKRQQQRDSIDEIYKAFEKEVEEKEKQRTDIKDFRRRELESNPDDQTKEASLSEKLEVFEAKAYATESEREKREINLKYLKALKRTLETGRTWHDKRKKLAHAQEQDSLIDAERRLSYIEEQRKQNAQNKTDELARITNAYNRKMAPEREEHNKEIRGLLEAKRRIEVVVKDTAHLRRAAQELNNGAKKLIDLKEDVNLSVAARGSVLDKYNKEQRILFSQREDAQMKLVLGTKKAFGFDSGLFRDVKNEIAAYQQLKQTSHSTTLSSAEYKKRTKNLLKALDTYCQERRKIGEEKKTDLGQVRLECVMQLRNTLNNNLRDMTAAEAEKKRLEQDTVKIDVEPKSKLELNQLKADKKIKKGFFDTQKADSIDIKKIEESLAPVSQEDKEKFALENEQMDAQATVNDLKDAANELIEAESRKLEALKAFNKEQEKLARKEAGFLDSEGKIPEVHFDDMSKIDPTWEKVRDLYPDDIRGKIDEYYRIVSNVPKDYGFEEFNEGRLIKYSLERYENSNKAIEKFKKDYHLHNPKITLEEALKIRKFDVAMSKEIDLDQGYAKYFANDYAEHNKNYPDDKEYKPLTQIQWLHKQGKLPAATEQDGREFTAKLRAEAARKLGVDNPRDKIEKYGVLIDEEKFVKEEVDKKLQEVKNMEKRRAAIQKEINSYNNKMAKMPADYGFEAFYNEKLKTEPPMSLDEYKKSGLGGLRWLALKENKEIKGRLLRLKAKGEQVTPEEKADLKAAENELDQHQDYGYKAFLEAKKTDARKAYVNSDAPKDAYMRKNKLTDPIMLHYTEICKDPILAGIYAPETIPEMTVEIISLDQLNEGDEAADYEKSGLDVLNKELNYKELDKDVPFNPLAAEQAIGDDDDTYYAGFDDYPDDLKKQIKEYDRIMAAVPKDWGYDTFEKNVDFCGRFNREDYINNGFGKKYFAQQHRLVNPRISKQDALRVKRYDLETKDVESKEAGQAYSKYLKEMKADGKKEEILPFKDYIKKLYGQEKYDKETEKAKLDYWAEFGTENPRETIPNYGRILLNKEEYAKIAQPIFDDTERINRNAKIIEEVKAYVDKLMPPKVPLGSGYKEYCERNTDIEDFMTQKEYAMSDEGRDWYSLKNNLVNPIIKYDKYIRVDAPLRKEIREATKDYLDALKKEREGIKKNWKDFVDKKEEEMVAKREKDRERTRKFREEQAKREQKNYDQFLRGAKEFLALRKANTTVTQKMEAANKENNGLGEEFQYKINKKGWEKAEANFAKQLEEFDKWNSKENRELIEFKRRVERFVDNMTEEDIPREEQHMKEVQERVNGHFGGFLGLGSWVEGETLSEREQYFEDARHNKLEELKKQRDRRIASEKRRKDPKVQKEIEKRVEQRKKEQAQNKKAENNPVENKSAQKGGGPAASN